MRTARRCLVRLLVLAALVVVGGGVLTGRIDHLAGVDVRDLHAGALWDRLTGTDDGADERGDARRAGDPAGCLRTPGVVRIGLSSTRYPEVRAHWEAAIARGRPRVLTVRRRGAAARRRALLRAVPTRPGYDRDEYPMAAARAAVDADVAYVDSAQNRGAGAVQGAKLRRWCSGQRFRVVWY
ncbi:NucA/NucB deoxyribonuclease domain-containing protein [Patulibacter sp. SYSU D01012]|uniref:NucA/NucB deoxyribonuclease domain-containing protein n=1 Tax=Patulibacter sp. SYSU D01012 TaxID=2817381 RepID=UPI001B30FD40|nr:NucA/NucB deoxyribonuclease domain-containing protein [Patulibacter sp. SYSU D01012]